MVTQEKLKECLDSVDDVVFALLFGSRATHTTRADSDWDIGVYLDDRIGERQRFHLRLQLLALLEDFGSIDLVVLNDAPPLVALRALQGKRILVKQPEVFIRFFVRTLADADDDRYWHRIHADARHNKDRGGAIWSTLRSSTVDSASSSSFSNSFAKRRGTIGGLSVPTIDCRHQWSVGFISQPSARSTWLTI